MSISAPTDPLTVCESGLTATAVSEGRMPDTGLRSGAVPALDLPTAAEGAPGGDGLMADVAAEAGA